MNWKESNIKPKEKFGWFAVAVLPRNHSGSNEGRINLEGDNSWRKNFGFTKAWLNNNEWYEPNTTGMRTNNITNLVTHWDYLPEVPILESVFHGGIEPWLTPKMNQKEIKEVAKKEFEKLNYKGKYEDFEKGFLASFEFMGIR